MDQEQNIVVLQREIAGLRFGLFLVASVGLAALAVSNLFTIWTIPKFERIFEDMLGSRDKLPALTRLVIAYARAGGNVVPTLAVGAFTMAAWSIMLLMRHSWKFLLVAVIAVLVLTAHGQIIANALSIPMQQIIMGINEKP